MELEHRESIDQNVPETREPSEQAGSTTDVTKLNIKITKKPVPATPRGVLAE